MQKLILLYKKVENTLSNMKCAVVMILLFTLAMIIGTFQESYHGAEYAQRTIYKTWWFMGLQFGFFLSVLIAALNRLPAKKRLYGFYTIHAGIIILIAGSFITYFAGIDGNITLRINSPTRMLVLPQEDVLIMNMPDEGKEVTYFLPEKAKPYNLNEEVLGAKLKTYLPYADLAESWEPPLKAARQPGVDQHSSQYFLKNPFVTQNFTLSLHNEARDYQSSLNLGPLAINYLPYGMFRCFQTAGKSGYIIWNELEGKCSTPEELNLTIQKTTSDKNFLVIKAFGRNLTFFPDASPWPLKSLDPNAPIQIDKNSPIRIFSRNLFTESPTLFLFGKSYSYYSDEKWETGVFRQIGDVVSLPWMGMELTLLKHEDELIPTKNPLFQKPLQDGGKLVAGQQRAIQVEIQETKRWIRSDRRSSYLVNGKRVDFDLTKRALRLPFELTLNRFKMDTDPGTNNPASYESFITLFTKDGTQKHHVFMNNPLKFGGFTFYQASYFQDENRNYGSVLSVNFDPGRFWKYLGSLILILGTMWHFYINRKSLKKRPETNSPDALFATK